MEKNTGKGLWEKRIFFPILLGCIFGSYLATAEIRSFVFLFSEIDKACILILSMVLLYLLAWKSIAHNSRGWLTICLGGVLMGFMIALVQLQNDMPLRGFMDTKQSFAFIPRPTFKALIKHVSATTIVALGAGSLGGAVLLFLLSQRFTFIVFGVLLLVPSLLVESGSFFPEMPRENLFCVTMGIGMSFLFLSGVMWLEKLGFLKIVQEKMGHDQGVLPEDSSESSEELNVIKPILLGWALGAFVLFEVAPVFIFCLVLYVPVIAFHIMIVRQMLSRSKETITCSIIACCGGSSVGVRFIVIPYELLFNGFFNKFDLPFIVNVHFLGQYHVAYIFFVVGSLLGYLIIYFSLVLLRKNLALFVSGIILCITAFVALHSLIPYNSNENIMIGILGILPFLYLPVGFGLGNIMVGLKQILIESD